MRSVSVRLADLDRVKINLGIAGENEHTHVLFDCKKAFDQYPNATPFLIVTPPRGDIYPAVVTRDGDIVEWVVTDSDLIYHGNGKVQLQFKQGDIIMKSYEARTSIAISSEPTGTVPTPIQNWITQANAILASIPDDINAALAAAKASGEFDGADGVGIAAITLKSTVGLVDTYTITLTDGRDYDFTVTNGKDGDDGDDGVGIQGIAKTGTVGLVDTYTITLTNGQTYTFTVTNGQGSSIVIDDVTPAVDKVFSSSKVDQELTDVKTAIHGMNTATASDVGKALSPKTVADGEVTEWQFVQSGGGSDIDDAAGAGDTDKAWSADKITEELEEKAPVIVVESDSGYYHAPGENIKEVTFDTNELTENIPVRYAFSKNLFEGKMSASSGGGLTKTYVDKRYLKLKGTASNHGLFLIENTTNTDFLDTLKGKTVKICVYISMQNTWSASYTHLDLLANGDFLIKNWSKSYGWRTFDVTFPDNLTSLLFKFDDVIDTVFEDGDFIWMGCYETAITDTETSITEPYTIVMQNGEKVIDTVMHPSIATFNEDTKKYVDEHTPDIIGFWNNHIYALPEDFGAVGNGVADDATAIAACLAYAATSGKAVRGYGKYKTSSPVVIGERYMDVYFREIYYTGDDAAVKLMNGDIRFEFHRITSTGIGVFFTKNSDASPKYASRCRMIGNEISSSGNCIQVNASTYYNTCEVRYLSSQNDNCIQFMGPDTGEFSAQEYVFRSSSCHCPNGYVAKSVSGSKLYDFTIEGDCKYGLYNSRCACYGFRHREQVDGMKYNIVDEDGNYNNGALITFTSAVSIASDGIYSFKYISDDSIPWYSIDVSAMDNYDSIPSGAGSTGAWQILAFNGNAIGTPIRGMDNSAYAVLGEKMFFIGAHKVFVPAGRKEVTITSAEYDYRLYEKQTKAAIVAAKNLDFATDFVIGVSHTDIYFNASFGAVGYNDLTVTQENGNTCTIYDKLGNVLFDGTNEGDGKWNLKCMMDRESCGRLSYTTNWWLYDGTNEKWEITKLE